MVSEVRWHKLPQVWWFIWTPSKGHFEVCAIYCETTVNSSKGLKNGNVLPVRPLNPTLKKRRTLSVWTLKLEPNTHLCPWRPPMAAPNFGNLMEVFLFATEFPFFFPSHGRPFAPPPYRSPPSLLVCDPNPSPRRLNVSAIRFGGKPAGAR